MNGWQLLDTVPKDATRVLFYVPDAGEPFEGSGWVASGWYDSILDAYFSDSGEPIEPTHWRALPKAPHDD